MEIKLERGSKSEEDLKVWVKTTEWELLRYDQLLKVICLLFANEDRLYPPPHQGRGLFFSFIKRAHDKEPYSKLAEELRQ